MSELTIIPPRAEELGPPRGVFFWFWRLFGRQPAAIALPAPESPIQALPAGDVTAGAGSLWHGEAEPDDARLVAGSSDAGALADDERAEDAAMADRDDEPESETWTAPASDISGDDVPIVEAVIVVSPEGEAVATLMSAGAPLAADPDEEFLTAAMTWLRLRLTLAALEADPEPDGILEALLSSEQEARERTEREARAARARMRHLAAAHPAPRFIAFCETFGLRAFERDVLLLCLGHALSTQLATLFKRCSDNTAGLPTFSLALRLAEDLTWDRATPATQARLTRLAAVADWEALSPTRPLRFWQMIEVRQAGGQPLVGATLCADERIVNHIKGLTYLDERLARLCRPLEAPYTPADAAYAAGVLSPSQDAIVHHAQHRLRAHGLGRRGRLVQLAGGDAVTKRLFAHHLATSLDLRTYRLPLRQITLGQGDLNLAANLWERERRLQPLALYLDAEDVSDIAVLLRLLDHLDGVVLLDYPVPLSGHEPTVRLDAPRPRPTEQRAEWERLLCGDDVPWGGWPDDVSSDWPARLAAQFSLNLPEMAEVVDLVRADRDDTRERGDGVWVACRDRARPRLDGLAQRLPARIGLDDVKLPPAERRLLEQIRDQTRHRLTVYDEYGFRDKLGHGLGISALFTGESGVGKTMAAEALATELGLDLYRIDLATVVSKYIGETEKNLKRIFDAAEQSGAVLLFDEADAIFGKRSEVKDSHDRYANIEVSYLLQRMEAYEGLAILTTNMKSALDPAFLRRLRFIVAFPFPSATEREAIWRVIFPDAVEGLDRLDFAALARPSLTGGQIRNIALNAAFLAAARDRELTMELLRDAARDELLRKQGKSPVAADYRGWESLEQDEAVPA